MQSTQKAHRPGPLHQSNKVHKGGRHSRKSTAVSEIKNKLVVRPNQALKREDRLNQANQVRKLKREKAIEEKRKLGTENQPPLLVGVLDLHLNSASSFLKTIRNQSDDVICSVRDVDQRSIYITSKRLKLRIKLIVLDSTDFDQTIDAVRSLDILLLLHSPLSAIQDDDATTTELLRAIYIHCMPSLIHVLHDTNGDGDDSSSKQFTSAKKLLRSKYSDEKVHCIEKAQDLQQFLHQIGNCKRPRSQSRNLRSTVVPDEIELIDDCLAFSGFVRHKILSPNDLVHVVGYGEFQIKKIDVLPDPIALRPASLEGSQIVETLLPDPMKQESLEQENELDPMEGEQTWPTSEELAEVAERQNTKCVIKRLPPGTSAYQGAWIPEESDVEDEEESSDDDGDARMEASCEDNSDDSDFEKGGDDDDDDDDNMKDLDDNVSMMEVDSYDKQYTNEKEMRTLEKLREARMNEMFPDEIDTPFDEPARFRFARYRGLKSFRTSPWDPQENLPPEYSRIFQFQNFHQTRRRVINDAPREGADPGQFVRVQLAGVPQDLIKRIIDQPIKPTLVALLKHERKMTVMNFVIKRLPDCNLRYPIKSKDELIFYVGFRKFKARPIFTTHSVSSKFKYERFLRDDVAMVATVYAPVTFPPAPVLVFRANHRGEKQLVASGSVLDSNPNRLVIKRIRLSGHPFKIHSKSAVLRFMFFNSEDVTYFKPVELITKYNRRGHITEPLGTHGHMKCSFDRKIRSDDCVFMNLYKRVFPKWTYEPALLM